MHSKPLPTVVAMCLALVQVGLAQPHAMLDESFSIAGHASLRVDVSDADVEVSSGAAGSIRVQISVDGKSEARARKYFEAQEFDVALRDGVLHVASPADSYRNIAGILLRDDPDILIVVTAPRSVDMRVQTSDGDIVVNDVEGDVLLKTSDGDITAGTLSGTMFEARTSDGDISMKSADFKNIVAQTSDGDMTLGETTAEEVSARTSDGSIHIRSLSGIADIKTSDGDIFVGSLVSASSTIHTADGDVVLEGVEGDLAVTASDGNVTVELSQPGDVSIKTSDGDVLVTLPQDLPADLTLLGSRVQLDCCPAFEGRTAKESVEGRLNGGGTPLYIRASDGTVVIRAQ